MASQTCSSCGVRFECGADGPARHCWCGELPTLMPLDFSQDCRCPSCLRAALRERIDGFLSTVTPEQARAGIGRQWASDAAPVEGLDYDVDGQGLLVFSGWYLLKRGTCCESGCRHCPYGFVAP